jgi:rsbT co-antagonist protein RsbR
MTHADLPEAKIARLSSLLVDLLGESLEHAHPAGSVDLDRIIAGVERLAAQLSAARLAAAAQAQRLDEIMTLIGALVSFDYTQRAHVGDEDDVFSAIAVGLNMLAEEMAATTVSKAYVDDMIASMGDPLVVVNSGGRIEATNRATSELSGYPKEALIGQPLGLLLPDFSTESAVRQGGLRDQALVVRTKDGRPIPVSLSASIMRQKHPARSEGASLVCVARDLTESQRIAEERWQMREALQRQAILLEELSTPIIPISRDVLVVPLIGTLDEQRATGLMDALLEAISSRGARTAIIDITGVRKVDQEAVAGILRAVKAVRLIGAHALLTGIRAEISKTLVEIGATMEGVPTFGTLHAGVSFAMRRPNGP